MSSLRTTARITAGRLTLRCHPLAAARDAVPAWTYSVHGQVAVFAFRRLR